MTNHCGSGGHLVWAHPQLDLVPSGYADVCTDAEIDGAIGVTPGLLMLPGSCGPDWDAAVARRDAATLGRAA